MFWRQSSRGNAEMVWTCAEERQWKYWTKNAKIKLPGKRQRGRPQRRCIAVVMEDMLRDRVRRRQMSPFGNPQGSSQKKKFHYCSAGSLQVFADLWCLPCKLGKTCYNLLLTTPRSTQGIHNFTTGCYGDCIFFPSHGFADRSLGLCDFGLNKH